jgi:hypothetical protein
MYIYNSTHQPLDLLPMLNKTLCQAYVSTRQHTSAYVSFRQHTSACVSIRALSLFPMLQKTLCMYVSIRQHTSAHVSIRQHTSAYVSIRQHTSATQSSPDAQQDTLSIMHTCIHKYLHTRKFQESSMHVCI